MNQEIQRSSWWIEIIVDSQAHIYYFENFDNYQEVENSKNKYIQDLEKEGAEIVDARVVKCNPEKLNIYLDYMFECSKFIENPNN